MADEMGNKELDTTSNESQEVYRIVLYDSQKLPQDLKPKVLANWLNSLKYGNDYFKLIDKDNYFPAYTNYINRLLSKSGVRLKFAELDDHTVIGWSMFEGTKLHYVFVNKDQHRQGIATALLPNKVDSFTHITNKGIGFWLKQFPNAGFRPFE